MIQDLSYYNEQARLRRVKDWRDREAAREALWRWINLVGAEAFMADRARSVLNHYKVEAARAGKQVDPLIVRDIEAIIAKGE